MVDLDAVERKLREAIELIASGREALEREGREGEKDLREEEVARHGSAIDARGLRERLRRLESAREMLAGAAGAIEEAIAEFKD